MTDKLTPGEIERVYGILNENFPYIGKKDKRMEALRQIIELFENKFEVLKHPDREDCPECLGEKDIIVDDAVYGQGMIICPACKGTGKAKVLKHPDRPKIVCLCGSTRFKKAFHQAYAELSDARNIVLTVSRLDPQHEAVSEAQDIIRHELHMRKIDLADELLVLNVNGYIGESLSKEIAYAKSIGKPIKYLEAVES